MTDHNMEKSDNSMQKSYFVENLRARLFEKQSFNNCENDFSDNFANFIRENDNNIKNDTTALFFILKKIMSHEDMLKYVYTYEMLNYEPPAKVDDISEAMNIVLKELQRYQNMVGGFILEDSQWIKCDNNTRFKARKNQIAIYNSIPLNKMDNTEFATFLANFKTHIRKFINNDMLAFNIKHHEDKNNDLCWILCVCEIKIKKFENNVVV